MKQQQEQENIQTPIQDRVFGMIDEQKVEPRSKYVFLAQNSSIWAVWVLTVVLGALATAVMIFTSTYRYYDIYEAMNDNFITFFFEALPVLWFVTFVGLMFVAVRGLRATKRGYRLSPTIVGTSSVGLSILFGFVCSALGFGFAIDKTLGEYAPMYYSQAEREMNMWQQPDQGRLIGNTTVRPTRAQSQATFVDSLGTAWVMDIRELRPQDRQLLGSQGQVRVLGKELEGDSSLFHACGVFPWMLDKKRTLKELSVDRKEYTNKLYSHMDSPDTRLREFEREAFGEARADNEPSMKICAEIAAVRRIGLQMQ